MIGSGPRSATFIDRIVAASEESALRDRDVLLHGMQSRPSGRADDRPRRRHPLRRSRPPREYDVDAQEVRTLLRLRQGARRTARRHRALVRPHLHRGPRRTAWHRDVDGLRRRPRRRRRRRSSGSDGSTSTCIRAKASTSTPPSSTSRAASEIASWPTGRLVCNMPRGLMEHSDVVTLFHEFGHLVHHVLAGRHDWVRFSGVATEWDFVEAPSQMLEEWAWDADILGIVRDRCGRRRRSRATWSRGCARPTTSAAATPAGRRCSTRRSPTTSTGRRRPT